MKARYVLLLCIAIVLTVSLPILATDNFTDPTGLLDIGFSARSLGLGGSFVGLADDVSALFYNPAGLASLKGWNFSSFYSTQFGVASYGSIGITMDNWGGGILYFNSSNIPKRNEADELTGSFSYTNLAGIGAYGVKIKMDTLKIPDISKLLQMKIPPLKLPKVESISFGLRGKYLHKNIGGEESVNAWSLDPAILVNIGKLRIGGMLTDFIGRGFRWSTHSESLKAKILLGFSYPLFDNLVLVQEWESGGILRTGAEFNQKQFTVRAGLCKDIEVTYTFGLGFKFREHYQVDYAYQSHPRLPASHLVSLSFKF